MNLASLVLSALSLIAVSLVGWHSWHLGRKMIKLASESVDATRQSAEASVRVAAVAEEDARRRRIEAALDIVVEMRALFNEQTFSPDASGATVTLNPAELAKLALTRRLDVRMVVLEHYSDLDQVRGLAKQASTWNTESLEGAIEELRRLLGVPAPPSP